MGTRTGSYYTGNLNGNAGSLITALDAILVTGEGWTKPYTGTNGAHYQQAGGNGFQVYVNDNGTGAGGAREAIVRGCESATAYSTLTDPFPTVAQVSDANCVWRKSDTLDATARNYYAVADDRCLIMWVQFGTAAGDLYYFGDIEPYWTGDNYATALLTRSAANSSATGVAIQAASRPGYGGSAGAVGFLSFARSADGLVKAERGAISTINNNSSFGNNLSATSADYPHPFTNRLHYIGAIAHSLGGGTTTYTDGAMPRGVVPYLFEPVHGTGVVGVANADTFTDTAYDSGSNFVLLGTTATDFANSARRVILQTAGTWRPGF